MQRLADLITLTTDFGLEDAYVGVMKGVIWSINPTVRVIDLCHGIPPQDLIAAGFVLKTAHPFFPPGTIHVVVVDPGVGSRRAIVAVRTPRSIFLAPDNGLLGAVLEDQTVLESVAVENPDYRLSAVSRTFHGRDIIAPAAAHLSRGVPLARLGPPITLQTLSWPQLQVLSGRIEGQVLTVDRFGNAISNLSETLWDAHVGDRPFRLEAGRLQIGWLAESYSSVDPGEPLALFGSSGHLELAVRGGNACRLWGLERQMPVIVTIGGGQ